MKLLDSSVPIIIALGWIPGFAVAKNPQVYPFDNIMPGPTNDLFYKLNASVALGQTTPADAVKQLQASLAENK